VTRKRAIIPRTRKVLTLLLWLRVFHLGEGRDETGGDSFSYSILLMVGKNVSWLWTGPSGGEKFKVQIKDTSTCALIGPLEQGKGSHATLIN